MTRRLGWLFAAIGAALLAGGLFGFASTGRFIARAARAPGTVVRVEPEMGSDNGTTYRPVVQFRTPAGAMIEFKSGLTTKPAAYDVGAAVAVLYRPDAPRRAEIDAFWALWFGPIILAVLGAIVLAVGAGVLRGPTMWPTPHPGEATPDPAPAE